MLFSSPTPAHTLTIQCEAIPLHLGQPALEPVRLSGHEGINGLFTYELLLKTPDSLNLLASNAADWDLDSFIGREISCTIALDGMGQFLPGGVGASVDHIGAGSIGMSSPDAEKSRMQIVQGKLTAAMSIADPLVRPWLKKR